jgi:hypothetical protein
MRSHLIELNRNKPEAGEGIQTGEKKHVELKVQNRRLAAALRKAEFRIAVDASTARILGLVLTRGPVDSDPEAA